MGKFGIKIEPSAQQDFMKIYKSGDKSTIKKLQKIMVELSDHPTTGTGTPELLKHSLSGLWSRCINKKDRPIYEIFEEPENLVILISALGHY
jgi:toxin YoeB